MRGVVLGILLTVLGLAVAQEELEANKAAVTRLHEAVSAGEWRTLDEVTGGSLRSGSQEFFSALRDAFPDLRVEAESLIAEGNQVVAFESYTGTHRGVWMGIPATGKRVAWDGVAVYEFFGGKIYDVRPQWDALSLLQQLDVVRDDVPSLPE